MTKAGFMAALCVAAALLIGCSEDRSAPRATAALPPVERPDLARASEVVRTPLQQRFDEATRLGDARSYGELGKTLLAAGYLDAAASALLRAESMAPGEFAWPYYLGHVHRLNAAWEKSAAPFERAAAIRPDDVAVQVWLGEARLALGEPDAATRAFERASSIDPSVSAGWFGLGRAALGRGDHQTAAGHLERALSLDPRASAIRYPLAMSYRGLGDRQKAEAHLRMRGQTKPALPDPLMRDVDMLLETATSYDLRALAALERGDWAAVVAAARAGIAVSHDNPPVQAMLRHRLGTALVQTGDARGAYEEFERAIAQVPDFARGHYSLGIMLYSMGRTREASERLTAAVRSDPVYVEARLMLGTVLLESGRAREGLEQFDAALEVVPDLTPAREGRAAALAMLQRAP